MGALEMKEQDLLELYQLLMLYAGTYGGREAVQLLQEVSERYSKSYGGNSISEKKNPRKAGRKKQYTEEEKNKIKSLRKKGMKIREIAKETGCSVGYVQGVLSNL